MKTTLSRMRMCVVSRERMPQNELIKITNVKGHWNLDEKQKMFGKSIYINLTANNLFKFEKQKKRYKMNDEEFEIILNSLKEMLAKKDSE